MSVIEAKKMKKKKKVSNKADCSEQDLHSYIPGFDPFVASDAFAKVVRTHLTKALSTTDLRS